MPEIFVGTFGAALFIVGIAWAILMFFAPFFWYGAWHQAKQNNLELAQIRKIVAKVSEAYMADGVPAAQKKDL